MGGVSGLPAFLKFPAMPSLRRRRIRMMRQTEAGECALAALAMVASYYRSGVDLAVLRCRFQTSIRGSTLRSLIDMAKAMGFTTRALQVPLESVPSLALPAILHWNMNHFVVVERAMGRKILVHDPEGRTRWLSLDEASPHFTGIALELAPGEDPVPLRPREPVRIAELCDGIPGIRRSLAQVLVLSIVLEAFGLLSPLYMRLAVDVVLPSHDLDLLAIIAIGFGLLSLNASVTSLLRSYVLASSSATIGFGLSSNVARRLLRLPIAWFERRHVGDIMSRLQATVPIRQFISESVITTLIDGCLAIISFAVMLFYSVTLAAVAATALLLVMLLRAVMLGRQRHAQEEVIAAASKEQSVMIETLRGIAALRLFNREDDRLAYWQNRLAESSRAGLTLSRMNVWQTTVSSGIISLETVVSTWLAIRLVLAGGLSLGMVFAYLAYKGQFLRRGASLVDQVMALRMLRLNLDQLSDIVREDEDRGFSPPQVPGRAMTGRLELRNIGYRYAPTDPAVLAGVDLRVAAGEHVAITGPSGCGKTTLVKIILGLVEPGEGEILVDGVPLEQFGTRAYRDRVGAVLQGDSLFAGSIADNIALFSEARDMDLIIASARAAAIDEEIAAMPMGYETLVGDMGSALSGGQRQRVLLARALYRAPALLVVDEGTSHLDEERERAVNEAIKAMGITRIVVAHRRQTIAAADRVFLLSDGVLVETSAPGASAGQG